MAGFSTDINTINGRVGGLVVALRTQLEETARVKAWFDLQQDSDLQAKGISAEDITLLRSAVFDLDKLRQVAFGQAEQVGANNFFWNARHLAGLQ